MAHSVARAKTVTFGLGVEPRFRCDECSPSGRGSHEQFPIRLSRGGSTLRWLSGAAWVSFLPLVASTRYVQVHRRVRCPCTLTPPAGEVGGALAGDLATFGFDRRRLERTSSGPAGVLPVACCLGGTVAHRSSTLMSDLIFPPRLRHLYGRSCLRSMCPVPSTGAL